MPGDRDFLAVMFPESRELEKSASDATDIPEGDVALYDAAWDHLEKMAADIEATTGKKVDFDAMSEDEVAGLLRDAVGEIRNRQSAVDEVGQEKIAAALDAVTIAAEFGEFMADKMYKAEHGFMAKTAELLKLASGPEGIARCNFQAFLQKRAADAATGTTTVAADTLAEPAKAVTKVKPKVPGQMATDLLHVGKKMPLKAYLGPAALLAGGGLMVKSMMPGSSSSSSAAGGR